MSMADCFLRDDEEGLRTSEQWNKIMLATTGFQVWDPDGWHRDGRFQYEWYEEEIDVTEFNRRAFPSTIGQKR